MQTFRTPLTALEDTFRRAPDSAAFKIPKLPLEPGKPCSEWTTVTYKTFRNDIRSQALDWSRILKTEGIAPGSVVTLWVRGWDYADVTLIYGVLRAGYVPQLVSFGVTSAEAIYEVAQSAQSRLLIADYTLTERLSGCPLPIKLYTPSEHPAGLQTPSEEECTYELPELEALVKDRQDTAFILLTSGSTSGKPKWVPYTWDWLDCKMPNLDLLLPPQADHGGQQVYAWLGTACHGGQFYGIIGSMKNGSCMVQPSTIPFSSDEFANMVAQCGVTTLIQFPPHYALHLKRARQDPKFLAILQKLDCTVLIGMLLDRDEMDWCLKQGIKLRSGFGSTECGTILTTLPDRPWVYTLADPSAVLWKPVEEESPTTSTAIQTTTASSSSSQNLYSLIVLSSSRDCPAPHLRSPIDGHYHMGDLFAEVEPGVYEPRGRADDWIKLANLALGRCDTKAIESAVLSVCRDLINACVVTGSLRPELVLFVEVDTPLSAEAEGELKREIIRRVEPVQAKMWTYEKIVRERQVRVVRSGVLPRTGVKGNIQRRKVEEMFKEELDEMYKSVVA